MENLLKQHDDPFHMPPRKSDGSPRLVASPSRSGLFMDHKLPMKNQDVTPASCSTDLEIAQARWEALVQMIELEEQSRARDVAELRMLIEQSIRGKPDLSSSKTAGWSLEGRLQEMMARIAAQEAQTLQLQAALAAPEKTFKTIVDELQATRDEATTALRRTSARLMEDFETKLEALKCLITTVPGQSLDKTQEVQIQGRVLS
ncbi:PAO, partial [Symbiodinium sp. CCMP2456]